MKLISSLCLILFCSSVLLAQNDSSRTAYYEFSPKLRLSSWQNNFEFSFRPNLMTQLEDSSSIMMRTRMQLAGMYRLDGEDPIKANMLTNILNPLKQQYLSTQSMKELKYVLGMVSAGGAAYLAYEHIKKYGFLKKK
jgi:hypothetical protein